MADTVPGCRLWVSALLRDEDDRMLIIAPPWTRDRFFRLPGGEVPTHLNSPAVALRRLVSMQLGVDTEPGMVVAIHHERPTLPGAIPHREPGLHLTFDCGRITRAHADTLIASDPRLVTGWRFATAREIKELTHPYQAARAFSALTTTTGLAFVEQPHRSATSAPPEPPEEPTAPPAAPDIRPDTSSRPHNPTEPSTAKAEPDEVPAETRNEVTTLLLDTPGGQSFMTRILDGLRRLDDMQPDTPTTEIPTVEHEAPDGTT
ncbi:hypothetical protein [Saccharothrix lopnurensis]|uniref:Nudix hydrolase domain-containing protein n=1 Tax=Saccharothrix lopnurensis TaxID=1670621 RepID=A0ABW1PEK0_9PSEU